ncbi:bile acid:sodium symporter family protein [Acidiphilium cryptum]|uniref:Bile acid:sodium symporter n=1 Tax=Acidiphilium cryptum (strain JF-5) TaxID=349163 RepID=A5FTU4_ACICJ|nr:bile acid:sodium symporter family protein [Acidiphilium cryptum]ABQ29026.1 Bile acid:sodium symporter [Acidiphilium cryptum JF-5]
MKLASLLLNKMMPVWLVVCGVLGYLAPHVFVAFAPYVIYYLAAVILMMSLTLTIEATKQVFTRPKPLISGFVIKWITVPLAAIIAAHLIYANQPQLAAGTILDGATPAGVTSNLFTFLSNGAVALAISLTFIHTLLSPLLTPAFTTAFAHKYVAVSFFALFHQMLVMVLLPLIIGIGARYTLGAQRIRLVQPVLPMISALLLYALALGLVAKAQPAIARNLDWVPIIAIVTSILTIINLAVGYLLARLLRLDESNSRAIMFDVGIYNSGLGAVLASLNFGAFAALPALMNAMLNMVIGSMLASYLGSKPIDQEQSDSAVSRPVTSQLGAE